MHLHIYCNYECLWLYILNLPVNWCNTMPLQKFIRLTEMLTAKESTVGGWMRRFQNQMIWIVQHSCFFLRKASPQQKYDWLILLVDGADCRVCKFFPAHSLMGGSLMGTYSQNCI